MKILVVEDDRKVAKFLSRVFTEEGFTVDLCDRGEDGVRQGRTGLYAVILLDWMLPDTDGVSVCRELRRGGCATPVLMLTARGELAERVLGLDAGADDYLVKPFELPELLARVRALLRRGAGPAKLCVGPIVIDCFARTVQLAGQRLDLTPREYALLLYLARNAGTPVPRTELLTQVWATSFDTGSNLVEAQVRRLREKLGAHATLIDTVRGVGYVLRAPDGAP